MTRLPENVLELLTKDGVSRVNCFDIISEDIILISTDKGTYTYTDSLYKKESRGNPWLKCSDNTLHRSVLNKPIPKTIYSE